MNDYPVGIQVITNLVILGVLFWLHLRVWTLETKDELLHCPKLTKANKHLTEVFDNE